MGAERLESCCHNQNNAWRLRSGRSKEGLSPGALEGSTVLPMLQFQTSRPQNCERMGFWVFFVCFLTAKCIVIVPGALEN